MKTPLHASQIIAVSALLLLAAVSAGALLYRSHSPGDGMTALVSVDGVDLMSIPLFEPTEPYEISLEEQTGIKVTLEVRDRAIRFLHSDCPDQICVQAGWLSNDMDIAICMPNRVSLVISPTDELERHRTAG